MNKLILLFLGITILSGCGINLKRDLIVKDGNALRQFQTTNPTFNTYVESFNTYGKSYTGNANFKVTDVPINFGDTENPSFEGVCFTYPASGKSEIIIRKEWWDSVNDDYRESLLFHELGHCSLNREHQNITHESGGRTHKESIMNQIIINPVDYKSYKVQYLTELFTQSNTTLLQALGL